jgi:glycosyltransferase involved in cell wall biosynthesis
MSNKWTIALVNWNSIEFIEYHAKFFHSFCDDFEFLVCDNTSPYQSEELDAIAEKYEKVKIIYPDGKNLSHGGGINNCLGEASGKYILIMDPDFFWMKKSILRVFEHYFDQGYHAIGTEFWDHPFPMPWGAAYYTDEIRDLDCTARVEKYCDKCNNKLLDKWSDTGWEIRVRLHNQPHFGFRRVMSKCVPYMGNHFYSFNPISFVYDGNFIAHHLMRGEYKNTDLHKDFVNNEMIIARKKYIEYFWSNLQD